MKLSSVDRCDYITLWTRIVLPDRPVQLPAIFRPSISNIRSDPECWMGPPNHRITEVRQYPVNGNFSEVAV